jgi:hypothetical protein
MTPRRRPHRRPHRRSPVATLLGIALASVAVPAGARADDDAQIFREAEDWVESEEPEPAPLGTPLDATTEEAGEVAVEAGDVAREETAPDLVVDDDAPFGFELTPPRIRHVEGEPVLFRPSEDDRIAADPELALAPGDRLALPDEARLELEAAPRVFVRAAGATTFELEGVEPDYLRFRLVVGRISVDARGLAPGAELAIATPHGEVAIEQNGYTRIDVSGDATRIATRRGGIAILTTSNGMRVPVPASRQTEVGEAGSDAPEVVLAPALDGWDRWNYRRTGRQFLARSD